MWKDFFYYSKSERRSILFLVGMGILLLFAGVWTHSSMSTDELVVDSIRLDSFCIRQYQKKIYGQSKRKKRVVPVLADFDPNTADSVALCRLGLPPFIAKRIITYRERGGTFREPEDLSRIYGLSEADYQRLKPYIAIDTAMVASLSPHQQPKVKDGEEYVGTNDSLQHRVTTSSVVHHVYQSKQIPKYPEGTVVGLNTADTSQLKRIPGIGSGLSKMIVAYRMRLGGYSDVKQLQEVAAMDTAIYSWFKIDSCIFRPLRVNRANLDQLRNHPYMNFYKAKVILEYRRKRGKIKGLSQLSMFQEFSEKDLQRLKPYLDFN